MRILILSCNTGGGHNSAADAICKQFVDRGISCDVHDALLFISRSHSNIVRRGHNYIYRHLPRFFGMGYRYEEKHPPQFIYDQIALGAKKFSAFLSKNKYDAIVCTHIFGNMLVTEARKKFGVMLPHYAVITDYALWPGTNMVDACRFFIAAEELRDIYVASGIEENSLVVSGIPIAAEFLCVPDKHDAREMLGLPMEGKVVLLFCGSIGCGKLNKRVPELEKHLPEDVKLIVICGNNKRLYKQLCRRCDRHKVEVVGYTDRVVEYMAASDLCLTKPGGLSTTEMLAAKLPMVLMLAVPGCETHNLAYFKGQGVALSTDDWDEAIHLTTELIRDGRQLNEMRHRLSKLEYPGGARVVVDIVLAELNER